MQGSYWLPLDVLFTLGCFRKHIISCSIQKVPVSHVEQFQWVVQYLFNFQNYTLQYTSVNIKKIKQNVEDGYLQKGRAKRSGKNYKKNK